MYKYLIIFIAFILNACSANKEFSMPSVVKENSPSIEMEKWLKTAIRSSEPASDSIDNPVSTVTMFQLNPDELNTLTIKANSGDSAAAFRISQYYLFSAVQFSVQERAVKKIFWLEVAANYGHAVAQHNLASHYLQIGEFAIAKRWALLSLKNGNSGAQLLLDDIKNKARNE